MCSSKPSAPKAPPPPPAVPETPRLPNEDASKGGGNADKQRRRMAAGQSNRGTILTGPRGVGSSTQKTLLGA